MALHDYRCPGCQAIRRDVYRTIFEGARGRPPYCETCLIAMEWIPQIGRMDASSGNSFVGFDTEILQPDGSHKTVHIGSLHQLRQVERESEQRAANGEGQRMVWRDFSQDRSNRDVHTIARDPAVVAREEFEQMVKDHPRQYRGKVSVHSAPAEEVAAHDYGPGVSDANTSSLGSP